MIVNTRFPLLSIIAKVLWIFSIILMLIGFVPMAFELFDFSEMCIHGEELVWRNKDINKLLISAIFIPLGIIIMAIAETISVFFAIELNTRKEIK